MALGCVLVANRGEIALRVLRSARTLGLRTVAVFSDADRDAPHVEAADEALRIGPAPASESYLSIPALLDAARRSGADSVHPGYGFLSESAAFARACAEAGLTFVGPPADAMERLGRKDEARRLAIAAGVPVLAAVQDASDDELAARAADEVGFPLMVKAAAGGGGRGMRVVHAPGDLPEALATARREAHAAFGDGSLLVERLVEGGRHVEVQVLADAHSAVVHLFERDCSTQRRHQKVLEESPAPTISAALRDTLTGGAVRLAREAGYVNAGTVEFLVDGDEAWMLEMNTRLQVEHPVTELVCGLDLVALQLRIAAGEPLGFAQDDVRAAGHAIEARIYAEDPAAGFLPQAGTASIVRWSPRARVDAALRSGQEVTAFYDPLLGKVIAHGATREAARARLVAALDDTAILGITTNLGWVRDLVASDAFRDAEIDTSWLDRRAAPPAVALPPAVLCAAAWAATEPAPTPSDPWAARDGWRSGAPPAPATIELERDGERHRLRVDRAAAIVERVGDRATVRDAETVGDRATVRDAETVDDRATVRDAETVDDRATVRDAETVDDRATVRDAETVGQRLSVRGPTTVEDGEPFVLEVDGERHELIVARTAHALTIAHRGHAFAFRPPGEVAHEATAPSDGAVAAPMPGTILAVDAEVGDAVRAGQTVVVMEAMKMELALSAPFDGALGALGVAVGERVALGHPLFRVQRDGDADTDAVADG